VQRDSYGSQRLRAVLMIRDCVRPVKALTRQTSLVAQSTIWAAER
jgi:hypothetical protein